MGIPEVVRKRTEKFLEESEQVRDRLKREIEGLEIELAHSRVRLEDLETDIRETEEWLKENNIPGEGNDHHEP